MKFNKFLFGLAIIAFTISSAPGQEKPHLWNVTQDGDTLHYVNVPASRTGYLSASAFPTYVNQSQYRQLVGDSLIVSPVRLLDTNRQNFSQILSVSQKEVDQLQSSHDNIWLPLTAMVISGGISAYYKLEANNTYEKYQRAVNEDNITRYYDLTQKYDSYSAISFVILQGSFGWMIYKLLR